MTSGKSMIQGDSWTPWAWRGLRRIGDHDGVAAGVSVNGGSVILEVGVFVEVLGPKKVLNQRRNM